MPRTAAITFVLVFFQLLIGHALFDEYFDGLSKQFCASPHCLDQQRVQGWRAKKPTQLPLLVFSLGVEGTGHHMWADLLRPVVDCTWQNGPYYKSADTSVKGHLFPIDSDKEYTDRLLKKMSAKKCR